MGAFALLSVVVVPGVISSSSSFAFFKNLQHLQFEEKF